MAQLRPMTQLDHFMIRNNQQPTPKRANSLRPNKNIQQYQHPNNPHQGKENQPLISQPSRSPARCSSRNTLSSHDNSQSSLKLSRQRGKSRKSCKVVRRHCQNHEDLEGSYNITIEGQDLFYCQKCANKLRNQGFPIKMENNVRRPNPSRIQTSSGSSMLESFPHLETHPQFKILKMLLSRIYTAEEEIQHQDNKNLNVDKIYEKMSFNFEETMDNIQNLIRIQRQKGRKLLKKQLYETQKHLNNQMIIGDSLIEIQVMKGDIQENIESIVGQIDTATFEQCVDNYQEKLEELSMVSKQHNSKLEKVRSQFEQISQQTYHAIKKDIESAIQFQNLQAEEQQIMCNEGMSNPKPVEGHKPFRSLFPCDAKLNRLRGLSINE